MRRADRLQLVPAKIHCAGKTVSMDTDLTWHDTDSPPLSHKSLCYRHVHLEEQEEPKPRELLFQKVKENCLCTRKMVSNCFLKLFPVLEWAPRYKIKEQLLGDTVSGIITGIVTIPLAISVSLLANQDPIYGLYSNFYSCLIYAIFTTSHHNCIGTYTVLCLMVGESVTKHLKAAGYNTEGQTAAGLILNSSLEINGTVFCDKSCYAIKIATSLTFLVGVYQIIFWILQLGFISVYLSEPLLSGFVTGSSLTILTSQMKYLFGLQLPSHIGAGAVVLTWIDFFTHIKKTNICDLITSIIAFAATIPIKEINERYKSKLKIPIPVEFAVVIVATLLSYFYNFNGKYKSSICGAIRIGFKPPMAPDLSLIPSLVSDAFPIAVVSFAITVSLAELFGKKYGYAVRANQEMLAIGMCNFIHSFLYCFTVSAALSKTLLRESTGGNTQVSSIFNTLLMLLALLVIAPLFFSLQISILGVILIVNLRGALCKFADMPNMWRISKIDTLIWWVSMLTSFLVTTEIGLMVGICFSLLCVIFRTQRPRANLLAKVSDTEIYEDRVIYRMLSDVPNIKIFRFDAPLYYANKAYFRDMLYEKTEVNPVLAAALLRKVRKAQEAAEASSDSGCFSRFAFRKPSRKPHISVMAALPQISIHSLIIDCGAMQFIDSVGLSVLKETHRDYETIGVHVFLANCNPSVRHSLQDGGFFSQHGAGCETEQLAFHSIHEAVQFAESKYREKQRETPMINAAFSFNPIQVIAEDTEEQTKV